MLTASRLLTTIARAWARLRIPVALILAVALLALTLVALSGLLTAPTEPVMVAPFRW